MQEETYIIEKIKKTIFTCDRCKGKKNENKDNHCRPEADSQFRKRIHTCIICGKDVCMCCSMEYDFDRLEPGSYEGDSPDYCCDKCWEIGKEYIDIIKRYREELEEVEKLMMSEWRSKARGVR
jgi:hypothetical protein